MSGVNQEQYNKPAPDDKGYFKYNSFHPSKVALLVPLSGKFKNIGKSLFDAANLALFTANEPNLILMPIDTKGTVQGAVDAYNQAMLDGVKLILGPVFGKSALAISKLSSGSGVNVITFSNDTAIADSGVFSVGHTPDQKIKRIVEYAAENGIEDIVAFLPNSYRGTKVSNEITKITNNTENLAVLRTEVYRQNKQGRPINENLHFDSIINNLLTTISSNNYDKKTKKYRDTDIKFPRGLLIIDSGNTLDSLIRYFSDNAQFIANQEKFQLLGTSKWLDEEVIIEPFMHGALFSAYMKNNKEIFEEQFYQNFGYQPIDIASLAYDLVSLSVNIAKATNGENFSKELLLDPKGFNGIDGIFRFKENGLNERATAVFQIISGDVEIVSKAPTSFESDFVYEESFE